MQLLAERSVEPFRYLVLGNPVTRGQYLKEWLCHNAPFESIERYAKQLKKTQVKPPAAVGTAPSVAQRTSLSPKQPKSSAARRSHRKGDSGTAKDNGRSAETVMADALRKALQVGSKKGH